MAVTDTTDITYMLSSGEALLVNNAADKTVLVESLANESSGAPVRDSSQNLIDISAFQHIDMTEKLELISKVSEGNTVVRLVLNNSEQGSLAVQQLAGIQVLGDSETGIITLSGNAVVIQTALSNILYIPNGSTSSVDDIDVKLSFLSETADQLELLHSETVSFNASSTTQQLDIIDKNIVRSSGESQVPLQNTGSAGIDNPNQQTTFSTESIAVGSISSEEVGALVALKTIEAPLAASATRDDEFGNNEAPTDIVATGALTVAEQVLSVGDVSGLSLFDPSGVVVATLSTIDENLSDTHTYAILSDPSGWFELINGNEIAIRAGAAVDFETLNTVNLTIRTTDNNGLDYAENITISIGDAEGTFTGTTGADNITGSSEEDVINGLAGDDIFEGSAGADTIDGGTGINQINYSGTVGVTVNLTTNINTGGDAQGDSLTNIFNVQGTNVADNITGDAFGNALFGQDGDDSIDGGDGQNLIFGQEGDDSLIGGNGFDTIDGGDGNDTIDGGIGNDSILGQAGNDSILGGFGDDIIDGGIGNDTIDGGVANDTINGGNGNDILVGANGEDTIDGGDGDDSINGGGFSDFLSGGAGADSIDGGSSNDTIDGGGGNDVILGGSNDDVIDGGDGDDAIDGGRNSDSILGGSGNDTIIGSDHEDIINGGAGQDELSGGTTYSDVFVFTDLMHSTSAAADVISDYRVNEDAIFFNGLGITGVGTGASDVTITDDGSQTFIDHNSSTFQVVLDGVFSASQLNIFNNQAIQWGSAGPDTLTGGVGSDALFGNSSLDLLIAGDGNDYLSGGDSDDTLDGGDGDDYLNGGLQNDVLLGGLGNDTLLGGGNDDSIDGGSGNDIIHGGSGNNSIDGGSGDDLIIGGFAIDVLAGDAGNDTIDGGDGTDSIDGGDDNDSLNGGADDDTINGDAGDDSLEGGQGADVLDGGTGVNTAFYTSSTSAVTINLDTDVYSGGDATGDSLTNIQNVSGSASGDSITGDGAANVLYGLAGNDTLIGGAGNDTFDGGAGADIIDGGTGINQVNYSGSVGVTINLDTNIHTGGDAQGDDLTDIRNVQGTNAADNITGDVASNILYGQDGDDTIDGGIGNDTIDGGDGDDVIDGSFGNDTIDGGNGDDFIDGGNGFDNISGGDGNDSINGGGQEDFLDGGAGQDTLTGGTQSDVFIFSSLTDSTDTASDLIADYTVNEDVIHLDGLGIMGVGTNANQVTITDDGIQTFISHNSSSFQVTLDGVYVSSDLLIIDDGNVIFEGTGSDTITGTSENDAIFGNQGNDSINGGDGGDLIDGGSNDDTINGENGNDVLNGAGNNDILNGGNGNDALNGGQGHDILDGGDGDDTISGGGSSDMITGGLGADDLRSILFSADLFVYNSLADSTTTSTDVISGYRVDEEAILLNGIGITGFGAGASELTVTDDGTNTFLDHNSSNFRIVINGVFAESDLHVLFNHTLSFNVNANDTITGSAINDAIYGGEGNDLLNGGDGDDYINSGNGNDTVYGGDGNDTLAAVRFGANTLDGGAGDDRIIGGSHTADLLEGGTGNDTIYGTGSQNTINGGDGNDSLTGGTSHDTIDGGDGDDTITGGSRSDVIIGGLGADNLSSSLFNNDVFVYNSLLDSTTTSADTISSFRADEEAILLNGLGITGFGVGASELTVTDDGINTFLDHNSSSFRIIINGVFAESDLHVLFNHTLIFGTTVSDTIIGSAGNDAIYGGTNNDTLFGGDGDDYINGGNSHDSIDGGDGNDTLVGSSFGANTIDGGNGNDRIFASTNAASSLDGGAGNDTINGGSSHDTIDGGDDNDSIAGGSGDDVIDGGNGNDIIDGENNNDVINGGLGNDTIDGGSSNDTINGDLGQDELTGGINDDIFVFSENTAGNDDNITDFGSTDTIALSDAVFIFASGDGAKDGVALTDDVDIFDVAGFAGGNFVTGGNATFLYDSTDGQLWYDADAQSGAGSAVLIATIDDFATYTFNASDFEGWA